MSVLKENIQIQTLENNLDWYGAFYYCRDQWRADRTDLDKSLRFLTETWYLLTYWDQLPHNEKGEKVYWPQCSGADYNLLQSALWECVAECDTFFADDPLYLCISGYLMQIQPEWFVRHSDWNAVYEEGRKRLALPQLKNNSESLFFREAIRNHISLKESTVLSLFPGNTEVERYFRSMLKY